MRSQRDAAKAQGTDFDEAAGCLLANDPDYLKRIAETALEEIFADDTAAPVVDPIIYAAIEAHRAAYAAYDAAAEGPDQGFRSRSRSPGVGVQPSASSAPALRTVWRRSLPRPRFRQTLTTSPMRSSKRPYRCSMISEWPDARPELRSRPSHHELPASIGAKAQPPALGRQRKGG
jgi:hypothetical protein